MHLYLLVHPEIYPSNDWNNFDAGENGIEFSFDPDQRYADHLNSVANCHTHRAVILDDIMLEEFEDYGFFQAGVSAQGWEVVQANPNQLHNCIISHVQEPCHITIAGFARGDCVRRTTERLEAEGHTVVRHEACTLPLDLRGFNNFYQTPDAVFGLTVK